MDTGDPVTQWISALKQGDQSAAQGLWEVSFLLSVGEDIRLNRALWALTERLAELLSSGTFSYSDTPCRPEMPVAPTVCVAGSRPLRRGSDPGTVPPPRPPHRIASARRTRPRRRARGPLDGAWRGPRRVRRGHGGPVRTAVPPAAR
jgi:hypothetical protein